MNNSTRHHPEVSENGIIPSTLVLLALDPEHIPLRLVRSNFNNQEHPVLEEHRSFDDLRGLKLYLSEWAEPNVLHLAVPGDGPDPLGALDWLEAQGYTLERFPLASSVYAGNHWFAPFRLPETHYNAYTIAVLAATRASVPAAALDLYYGLLHVKDDLNLLQHQVAVLTATLTETDSTDPADFRLCPF